MESKLDSRPLVDYVFANGGYILISRSLLKLENVLGCSPSAVISIDVRSSTFLMQSTDQQSKAFDPAAEAAAVIPNDENGGRNVKCDTARNMLILEGRLHYTTINL